MNIWSFHQFKYTIVHSGNWSSVPVKFTCWNNIFKGLLLLAKLNLSSKTWLALCSAADLATWFIIKDDSNTDKPKDKHILQWFTNTTQHNTIRQRNEKRTIWHPGPTLHTHFGIMLSFDKLFRCFHSPWFDQFYLKNENGSTPLWHSFDGRNFQLQL